MTKILIALIEKDVMIVNLVLITDNLNHFLMLIVSLVKIMIVR